LSVKIPASEKGSSAVSPTDWEQWDTKNVPAIEQYGYDQYMLGQEKLRQKLLYQLKTEDEVGQKQGIRIKDLESELELQEN
jgi:hypothetical protein